MTRQDYIIIAAALARTRPALPPVFRETPQARQWLVTRDAVIGALRADNPRFDRVRFVRATEV